MTQSKAAIGAMLPFVLGVAILGVTSGIASAGCQLNAPGGHIKRVVNIVFDNVHLRRDNPNVPSDLEQMPTPSTSSRATASSAAIITRP